MILSIADNKLMVAGMKYDYGSLAEVYWQGNQGTRSTKHSSAILSTINPRWATWDWAWTSMGRVHLFIAWAMAQHWSWCNVFTSFMSLC